MRYRSWLQRAALLLAGTAAAFPGYAAAQSAAAPTIQKIDPPGWWASMPAPMLLVRGGNLVGARFGLSDAQLHISKTDISANGHWAQLWLDASPTKPETVTLTVHTPANGEASARYTFAARRPASEGFAGFSSKDVLYLIMTDRFADGDPANDHQPDANDDRTKPRGWHGGDLKGIEQHLDYLQQLGVTAVWTTPVYQNHEVGSYHGYGATDLYAVDEHFGSMADLQSLVRSLHARGMRFVLDIVPNHIGPAHPWVEDEPTSDWFHGTKAQHRLAQGDFRPLTSPHAPWRDQQDTLEGWFANILPDMNTESPAVARYLTQNAIWWTEQTGLDGFRIDTFPYVGRQFWHDFHAELKQLYPHLTTVGEIFNGDPTVTSFFAGGVTRPGYGAPIDTGLDTPFDFPSYFAIRDSLLHGAPMARIADILRQDDLYPHPERLVPFLGNHDTMRFLSEPGATPEKLRLAFLLLLTMRGMPELYSGDEIAMPGGDDPDNRRDFPGGFPGDPASAFTTGGRTAAQESMHAWVESLLRLRNSSVALTAGAEQIEAADEDTIAIARGGELAEGCSTGANDRILVAVNRSTEPKTLSFGTRNTALAGCVQINPLLSTAGGAVQIPTLSDDHLQLTLPPQSGVAFRLHR